MITVFIENILGPKVLEALGLVLLPILIGVFAKIVSRGRKRKSGLLNEWNVGFDLIVTTLVLMLTRSADRFIALNQPNVDEAIRQSLNAEIVTNGLIVLWLVAILFGTSAIIRFWGWRNKNDLHSVWGVILPDLIGLTILGYVLKNHY